MARRPRELLETSVLQQVSALIEDLGRQRPRQRFTGLRLAAAGADSTEMQRIAYVGLCALAAREMADGLRAVGNKELSAAIKSTELWSLKILGRLYYHMELATEGELVPWHTSI